MAATDSWAQYRAAVEARLDYREIYAEIEKAKPSGENGWRLGLCPFHEDHDPSFAFSTTMGRWTCHAGCGEGSVFDYLARRSGREFKAVLLELGDRMGVPRPSGNGQPKAYDYHDESGALLFQVLRSPGKKFWQRRPDGKGGWIKNLKGVRRVLYRLPELLARPDETVFVVEGEKDADRLHSLGLLATTNPGGAGKWQRAYSESLAGREVVILPDNDPPGRDHAEQVARALGGIAASVRVVALPDLPPKGDVSDWLAAGQTVDDLKALVAASPLWQPAEPVASRPQILANGRQLRDVIADAWAALLPAAMEMRLFRYAGSLARIVDAEGGPLIALLDETGAYGLLVRVADWVAIRREGTVQTKPPHELARDLLAFPHPDLPALDGVVTTPVFTAEGRLLTVPGYDPASRLWYEPLPGFTLPEIPAAPSEEETAAAARLLTQELLVDFPFRAESDEAHVLAALILLFVRRLIAGPTPIHLIEAPTPGSGKGLLAILISIIALGRLCEFTTVTRDEDELRKKLTSILSRGRQLVVLDNIQGGLESAQVAAAITAEMWSDRLLGKNQMVDFPNRAVWVATANNPKLSLEIARRCARIRLEPPEAHPWERTGFKHDPLSTWAMEHRQELVRAVLVICQSWLAAGRPVGKKTLGSFENWAQTVGGILRHAGITEFLQDTGEFYAAADPDSGEWQAFVQVWWDRHADRPVTARELIVLAGENDMIDFAYTAKSDGAQRARLGRALSALRGRKFSDLQIVVAEDKNRKTNTYRLVRGMEEPHRQEELF